MKFAAAAAAAALLVLAGAAPAQSLGPDPVRLGLAKQVVAIQGGEHRMRVQVDKMIQNLDRMTQAALPPDAWKYGSPLHEVMRRQILAMVPDMIKVSETVYADQLSEQELKDMLAWMESPSGRAVTAKAPAILEQAMQLTAPLVAARMPAILHDSVKAMCVEQHCSPDEQQVLASAMDGVLSKRPAG